MKRTIQFVIVLLMSLGFSSIQAQVPSSATPTAIGNGVELTWYQAYPDLDFPRLIGDIKNSQSETILTPSVFLQFTDAEGNVYGTTNVSPLLPELEPGQSVGIMAYMSDIADGWTNLQAQACPWNFDYDPVATASLRVDDLNLKPTGPGRWSFDGWIANDGPTAVPYVSVILEARDPDTGRFIGSTSASIDTSVPAGKKGAFSYFITQFDLPGWTSGMEPEFTAFPLVSALTGYGSMGC